MNLGAGRIQWPGWVPVGHGCAIDADLKRLPFPDNYADQAAAIHVIEHFYQWEAPEVLKEWLRVLKPGGKLILECPCLDKVYEYIVKLVQSGHATKSQFMTTFVFWGDPKYRDPYMVHRWGYFKETLVELMQSVGFRDVTVEEPRYHFAMRDMRVTGVK